VQAAERSLSECRVTVDVTQKERDGALERLVVQEVCVCICMCVWVCGVCVCVGVWVCGVCV